jgi:hypothetical protein
MRGSNRSLAHSTKAGDALLLDVIERCVIPGLASRNIANALEPKAYLVLTPRTSAGTSRVHTLVFRWPSGLTLENHNELSLLTLKCLRATEPPG